MATTATTPVEVMKTRAHMDRGWPAVLLGDVRRAGPAVLFRGWTVSYARVAPHSTIIFVLGERLRQLAGAPPL